MSAISSACSPVSGWEISRSSIFTPSLRGVLRMSSACSASMKAAVPPSFLHLGDDLQGQRGLAGGFRPVDLDHPAARQAAHAQRDVQAERAGGHHLDVLDASASPMLHDGALAELLFDLRQCRRERLAACCRPFPYLLCWLSTSSAGSVGHCARADTGYCINAHVLWSVDRALSNLPPLACAKIQKTSLETRRWRKFRSSAWASWATRWRATC